MRKIILLLLLVLVSSTIAQAADFKMKDMADDHWAAAAVYDLIRLGITKGFPDGTFRGDMPTSRYETAMFLSKLAKSFGSDELRADVKALRDKLVELQKAAKDDLTFQGSYNGDWLLGNLLAVKGGGRGGAAKYRLMLAVSKEVAETANIKIDLDTMDYGYFDDGSAAQAGRGLLASELLAIESNLKLNLSSLNFYQPVDLMVSYGGGPKRHSADPTRSFPSEIGVTYIRPNTGLLAQTKLLGADVQAGYYSLQPNSFEASGLIKTDWLTGTMSYTINRLKIDVTGDYIAKGLAATNDRTIKAKIGLTAPIGDKVQASGTVGLAKANSKMMAAGSLSLNDPWDTGTVLTVRAARIGSAYIDQNIDGIPFYLAGYDNFSRPLENGTFNFGGELTQFVSDKARLIGKGELRTGSDYKYSGAKARLTLQGGIAYNVAPNVDLAAAYRVFQDKNAGETSDLASLGLLYRF